MPNAVNEPTPTARLGLMSRFVGTIVSPRATFEQVAQDPRWLGVLVLTLGLVATFNTALLSTEVGERAMLQQQVQAAESFGIVMTDEQYDQMADVAQYAVYFALAGILVQVPIINVVLAGILFVVANVLLGARSTFKQVFAVVAHSGVILVVQGAFVAPLNFVREAMSNPATLAAFVPMLDPETFLVRMLGVLDVFFLWRVMVLAIGTAVVTERRTGPIAVGLFGVYAAIAVAIAIIQVQLSG